MGRVKAVNEFGLDAEIAERRNANYPHEEEKQAQAWIETILGVQFDKEFGEYLQNGVVLCHLMNTVQPGKIKKIYEGTMPFKLRENISAFVRGCREMGVPEGDLFTTEALFEQKDIATVVLGLFAFSRAIQTNKSINFKGPILGAKVQPKGVMDGFKNVNPNATVAAQNMGSSGVMEKTVHEDVREKIKTEEL
uniref:Calponin-homology (CH) domain-containing protein n=1 Tax=Aplanochytrium stocchinoi TaxID=215587 RepID=A0A7S3V0S6_9STRA|mmetsp:Transcript_6182/g.8125  ORF Transcript_6182/g.8125 Transcript_6182/m.8125 type:complete len:193 (+) Transcript_6182:206-784(+)